MNKTHHPEHERAKLREIIQSFIQLVMKRNRIKAVRVFSSDLVQKPVQSLTNLNKVEKAIMRFDAMFGKS